MAKTTKRKLKPESTTYAEWVAATLGVLLLFGAIGYLVYAEVVTVSKTPDVAIERGTIKSGDSGYIVEFTARNRSGFSAARLKIRGELRSAGDLVETSETELDYLPAYSSRAAGLYFQNDPADGELKIFPVSYVNP